MKLGFGGMLACGLLLGCGRSPSGDVTGVSRGSEGRARGASATGPVGADSVGVAPDDAAERLMAELSALPHLDPSKSKRQAPDCQAPTSVGFSHSGNETRAARLLWDPETGECALEDVDRATDGTLGILSVRSRDEHVAVSAVGKWRFYAPSELDLADVPPNEPFTIYPYLGDWQFVATLEHNTELVKLLEFAYLRGEGPSTGGARGDLEDQPPSDFVPPTLCAPAPENGETP